MKLEPTLFAALNWQDVAGADYPGETGGATWPTLDAASNGCAKGSRERD